MTIAVDILGMTVAERLELIERLWISIEDDRLGLSPAQQAEIERRLAVMDQEPVYSWQQVRDELLAERP